jgi:hypothetical protein
MNHHSYVAHLDVQSVFLLHHFPFISLVSCLSLGPQFFVKFLFKGFSAFDFPDLGCEFLLDYPCVSFIEVLLQIIFDEDERYHKVVSCMVGDAIVIEKMVQALRHQVILHQFMV